MTPTLLPGESSPRPPLLRAGLFAALVFTHDRRAAAVLSAIQAAYEADDGLTGAGVLREAADAFPEFSVPYELLRYWAPHPWAASEVPA
jgi:hypothetical protein